MTEKFLHRSDIAAIFQEVGCKAVPVIPSSE
jgi:hypothetical protein